MLSDSEYESENEDLHQLTVNEHFAKAYKAKKEREELQQRMSRHITPISNLLTGFLFLIYIFMQIFERKRHSPLSLGGWFCSQGEIRI
jgi:hypothetical protein